MNAETHKNISKPIQFNQNFSMHHRSIKTHDPSMKFKLGIYLDWSFAFVFRYSSRLGAMFIEHVNVFSEGF